MPELPSGTPGARPPSLRSSPAFLFTDVEGSIDHPPAARVPGAAVPLWERHPEARPTALARHRRPDPPE